MSTISDQLTLLNNTKTAIRTAINNKGGSVSASDTFASYATAITNLPSGGDDSTLRDLIERDITSITIPSGTTNIGQSAFQNCTSLTSISIPNTVTSIGNNAFFGCSALQSINIPSSVTTLDTQCFANCIGLTSITIPDSVTTIPSYMVNYCDNLTEIIVGNNVSTIQIGAFSTSSDNYVLRAIVINTTSVPNLQSTDAFNYTRECPIYVPSASVNAYKTGYKWSTYASRIYPIQQVATVDGNPVYNYDLRMTSTDTITSENMDKMPAGTSVEFAEGLTNIAAGEINYQEVTLPSTFTGFGEINQIGSSVMTITSNAVTPPSAFRNQLGGSGLTAIYVPAASVDAYKEDATWSSFASIIQAIPEDVKPAFKFTSSVDSSKDITVNCEDTATAGTLTTNDLGMSSQQIDEFKSAENTGSVEIGDCVKIYRATNCYTAKGISEVKLNEGLERIEDFAFGGMSALREITIPSTVTNISYQAFYADRALQGITCLATTPPTLGSDVFGDTNNCTIYVPGSSLESYKTAWSQYADRIEPI